MRNPEGYTGYAGPKAHRIWRSVYEENCFDGGTPTLPPAPAQPMESGNGSELASCDQAPSQEDMQTSRQGTAVTGKCSDPFGAGLTMGSEAEGPGVCLEERVFRRLVSGLHTSISTHIAATERIDEAAQVQGRLSDRGWAVGREADLDSWLRRVGRWPDRLHNLYFAYVFALRSVAKAAPLLELAPLRTGNTAEDAVARDLLRAMLRSDAPRGVLFGFDESKMFRVDAVDDHDGDLVVVGETTESASRDGVLGSEGRQEG